MNACPDALICPISDCPIAVLGCPPALANRVTNAHNQHTPFGKWLLKLLRHSLIDRTPQRKDNGVLVF